MLTTPDILLVVSFDTRTFVKLLAEQGEPQSKSRAPASLREPTIMPELTSFLRPYDDRWLGSLVNSNPRGVYAV